MLQNEPLCLDVCQDPFICNGGNLFVNICVCVCVCVEDTVLLPRWGLGRPTTSGWPSLWARVKKLSACWHRPVWGKQWNNGRAAAWRLKLFFRCTPTCSALNCLEDFDTLYKRSKSLGFWLSVIYAAPNLKAPHVTQTSRLKKQLTWITTSLTLIKYKSASWTVQLLFIIYY